MTAYPMPQRTRDATAYFAEMIIFAMEGKQPDEPVTERQEQQRDRACERRDGISKARLGQVDAHQATIRAVGSERNSTLKICFLGQARTQAPAAIGQRPAHRGLHASVRRPINLYIQKARV